MTFAPISLNLAVAMAAILILLAAASGSVFILRRKAPDSAEKYDELDQRIKSWWMIVALFFSALLLQRTAILLFFALVSFLALKEYLSLIPTRRADRRVLFWAYLAIPLQYYWISIGWYGMFIIFIPVYLFLFLPMRMLLIGETQGFLRAAGTLHWGMMITVFGLSHAAYLAILPGGNDAVAEGAGLVFFLVFLTQINDVAQYVWGKTLGRHKVVPSVSPNKTYAGVLGGVLTTTLLATVAGPALTPMTLAESAAAGLLIGLFGFIGDINISALKRDLGVKDSGSLLPGHGGILDRVDSLSYTAPLFFHFIHYVKY